MSSRAAWPTFYESSQFRASITRLDRLTLGIIDMVRSSWMQSSRHLPILDGLLMYSATDEVIESVIAIRSLVQNGVHNVVRRESRFLLEQAVKLLYVDQQLPSVETHSRDERLDYLADEVSRSSIEPVARLPIIMGGARTDQDYRDAVKSHWAKMAGYVHPSKAQTEERLGRAARGAYIGFEDAKALDRVVAELALTYDLLGVLWLMAAGPSAAGDILLELDQPGWVFAKSSWLANMSRFFDYKSERRQKPGDDS
jgi:hypothetical protein